MVFCCCCNDVDYPGNLLMFVFVLPLLCLLSVGGFCETAMYVGER